MRKITILISLLLLFSLLLTACGGADEGGEGTAVLETPATGFETDISPGQEETEVLATPLGTIEPTEMATEVVTEAPTELASPTVATTTEIPTTPAPVIPGTGFVDPSRLSNLLGLDVRNAADEEVGQVDDMVIDLNESQVRYVILASGGILGIGERLIPVPWEALSIDPACADTQGADDTGTGVSGTPSVGGMTTGTPVASSVTTTETPAAVGTTGSSDLQGECFFLLNIDQPTLESAPNVDLSEIPDVSVEGWDQEFLNYWNSFDMGPDGEMVTGTPAAIPGTGTPATGGTGSIKVSEMQDMILAEDLLSLNLVSRNGDPLGEIEDAIVDLETGVLRYILISADASLDIAGNWVPVPLETLGQGSNDELVLDVSDDAMNVLVNAPNFDANSMPNTSEVDWDADITSYWSTISP